MSFTTGRTPACRMTRTCLHLLVLHLTSILIASCAELNWQKPGANQTDVDRELAQCRQDARLQASHEILPMVASPQMVGGDPQGHPIVVQSHQRDAERLLRAQELMRSCMRDRGYVLGPSENRRDRDR
jgi:hypothetical protein